MAGTDEDPATRIADDHATPFEHRHDREGARFREYRAKNAGASWESYQREKERRGSLSDLQPRDPPSPEAVQRGFRAEHDTGDLDRGERELLEMGVAPPLTPARFVARFGGVAGMLCLLVAMVIGWTWSVLVAAPMALLGGALFLHAIFRRPLRRTSKTKGKR